MGKRPRVLYPDDDIALIGVTELLYHRCCRLAVERDMMYTLWQDGQTCHSASRTTDIVSDSGVTINGISSPLNPVPRKANLSSHR